MERLDLSTYAKEIKNYYDSVVSGDKTYAIFKTLKDSSLKPILQGDGDIKEFVSEFEEGSVQFGVLRVNPFGSDVQKLVLLGWCPDSAPIKSKVSYATNLSAVGKVLHYHVEITARDSDDLDIDDIMKTVSNASGARYSIQSLTPSSNTGSKFKPTPKPASAAAAHPKPESPVVQSTPGIIKPKPVLPPKKVDSNDGWGDEEEVKERDFSKNPLETLPSAYKPTKVDIHALRNSAPVSKEESEPATATISINPSGGLTSLPKPKPSHSVLSRYNEEVVKPKFGSAVPVFDNNPSKDSSKLVGGLSRNFGAQNGKTPAQLWAEKKGQYKDVPHDDKPVNSEEFDASVEKEDVAVSDVKAKFEKIHLEAEEEEKEETKPITASFPPPPARETSSFPPPPARETSSFPPPPARETSSFPPPPARETSAFPPPPKRDLINKFEDKEPESNADDEWNDGEEESTPVSAAAPARPVAEQAPVVEQAPEVETKSAGHTAVAEYDYEKDEDNEIELKEGEIVTDIQFVDEDWWQGTNSRGETGLFPSSYVSLKEEASKSTSAAAPPVLPSRNEPEPVTAEPEEESSGLTAVAEFDYDATEDNELSFKEGELITNIEKVDEDWWLGTCNGQRNLFPSNYVTLK